MEKLFCDCKTDAEKSAFFLSGRAVETGVIAAAISNDVAMAYHRCDEFKKEVDALRAKIAEMEQQEPVKIQHRVPFVNSNGELVGYSVWIDGRGFDHWPHRSLYLAPGAKGEEKK